jgi:phosphoribosyl 1,2-cyclic phosphate phosphodiesterase
MTIDYAIAQINRVQPKQAYLTHMCHDIMHAEEDAKLPPNINLSYDGLRVDL